MKILNMGMTRRERFFYKITKIFTISFILFLVGKNFGADKTKIQGYILDQLTHQPVAKVNVYIEGSDIGAETNEKGYFSIQNAPTGECWLIIEHIGFEQKRIKLNLKPETAHKLNIYLAPRVIIFNEISLTANRTPESLFKSHQSIAIAGHKHIELRTSPNTADALRELPGILVQKTTAGHGSPIIRGMIGKDVLLLYNSIRLNKPTFRFGANQYMNTINAEILERIEVVKGPGSVMYGSDAIGGLINLIPIHLNQMLKNNAFSQLIQFRYGSADNSRLLNFFFSKQFKKISLFTNLGFKKIDDLTAGSRIGRQNPTGYSENDANLKIYYAFNENTGLEIDNLAVLQSHVPRYDKYVTGEYQQYVYHPQNRYLSAITLNHNPLAAYWIQKLRWNFSFQFEQEGVLKQKYGKSRLTEDNNELTTWGSYLQINSIINQNHNLTYGYEIYFDRVHSTRVNKTEQTVSHERPSFPDGSTYLSTGIFVNDEWILSRKLDFTLGLRWSYIKLRSELGQPFGRYIDRNQALTSSFGFRYQLFSWLNFTFTYSQGFRAPNFNDTVVLKVSNAGMDAPSPGLRPEKSHNFELGLKWQMKKSAGSMFLFYNQLTDLIERYRGSYLGLPFFDDDGDGIRDPDEVDIFQKKNVGKAYITGWEVEGSYQLSENLNLRGFAFWTYGQNKTLNEPMSRIPPLMAMVSLQYHLNQNWEIEAFLRAAGAQRRLSSRDKDDSRIPEGGTPGWKTFNCRTKVRFNSNLSFHLTIENIFDETYKEHGSGIFSPGRGLVIGIRWQK